MINKYTTDYFEAYLGDEHWSKFSNSVLTSARAIAHNLEETNDKVGEIVSILTVMLGKKTHASEWLNYHLPVLGNTRPTDLLSFDEDYAVIVLRSVIVEMP